VIWSINAKNDPYLTFDYEKVDEGFVRIDEIESLEAYLNTSLIPAYKDDVANSKDGAYYVTISGEEDDEKVVVAIGPRELNSYNNDANVYKTFYGDTENITTVDYTGYGSGIAYVSY
jgi:hypothetical protein